MVTTRKGTKSDHPGVGSTINVVESNVNNVVETETGAGSTTQDNTSQKLVTPALNKRKKKKTKKRTSTICPKFDDYDVSVHSSDNTLSNDSSSFTDGDLFRTPKASDLGLLSPARLRAHSFSDASPDSEYTPNNRRNSIAALITAADFLDSTQFNNFTSPPTDGNKVEELEMSSGCCNIVRNLFRRRSGDGEAEPLITTPRSQASQLPQFIAALAATLGGFVMGSQLGWTSPTKAEMVAKYSMSDLDWSWVSGILPAGAMVGALAAGSICDQIGRRMTIIVTVIPSTVGWAMILWAPGTWMVILGRAVLGSVSGVLSCACPLYTNEIAETAIRGTLGTFFQLQVTLGILFSYIVGALIKVTPFSIVCVVIPFVPSIIMFFMPESPTYYLKKGDTIAAKNSLQRLRGGRYNVDNEIATTQKILEE
ncbi:hypothetical protein GE061_015171, partial [Apolygus lucorum]